MIAKYMRKGINPAIIANGAHISFLSEIYPRSNIAAFRRMIPVNI
jgi:hypothetical protein